MNAPTNWRATELRRSVPGLRCTVTEAAVPAQLFTKKSES